MARRRTTLVHRSEIDGLNSGDAQQLTYAGDVVLTTASQGMELQYPGTGGAASNLVFTLAGELTQHTNINFEENSVTTAQLSYRYDINRMRFRTTTTGDGFLFLNDVDGTYLEMNGGQIGFHGNTPIAQPNYTLNTFSTDRNLTSSASATLQEVADVLATLINDLTNYGLLQ